MEPDSSNTSRLSAPPTGGGGGEEVDGAANLMPLGESVLVENLGVPVVVVVTKVGIPLRLVIYLVSTAIRSSSNSSSSDGSGSSDGFGSTCNLVFW